MSKGQPAIEILFLGLILRWMAAMKERARGEAESPLQALIHCYCSQPRWKPGNRGAKTADQCSIQDVKKSMGGREEKKTFLTLLFNSVISYWDDVLWQFNLLIFPGQTLEGFCSAPCNTRHGTPSKRYESQRQCVKDDIKLGPGGHLLRRGLNRRA